MRVIGGSWGGRRIKAPPGRHVRPTSDRVREAWMSALGGAILGARVLDLYAGSGALGIEALSRGAESVVFVDRAQRSLTIVEVNVALFEAGEQSRIVRGDVFRYVKALEPLAFDLAFADPPYADDEAERLVALFVERPFARALWVEHRAAVTFPQREGLRTRLYGDTALTAVEA